MLYVVIGIYGNRCMWYMVIQLYTSIELLVYRVVVMIVDNDNLQLLMLIDLMDSFIHIYQFVVAVDWLDVLCHKGSLSDGCLSIE